MAPVTMEWESRLGRRLRVRDLYILSTTVKRGSMAGAARELRMSQPAVSEAIANLEHVLGVPLLERSARGVAPTFYGDALLKRSDSVFDELKQSVRDIEFLADPSSGQLSIGSSESIIVTVLPLIIERFRSQYPRAVIQIEEVPSPAINAPGLRDRRFDLVFARWHRDDAAAEELEIEPLFEDPFVIATTRNSPLARRRKLQLADLAEASWILPTVKALNYVWLMREFRSRGLSEPKAGMMTTSGHLTAHFMSKEPYVTVRPRSWVLQNGLTVLPVDVALAPISVAMITLKHRTLSPLVERFVDCAREVGKSFNK